MEAAAAGSSPNSLKLSRQELPNSRAITWWTIDAGMGGAASWSFVSVARYGAMTDSGNADSKIDKA